MKKINSIIAIAFVVSLLTATLAKASPFYVSFNAGISKLNDFCANVAAGYTCKDTATAGTLDLGFQASDMIGLELGYGNYGKPVASGIYAGSNLEVTEEISGLRLMGIASIPVSKSFAFTGKLGVSRANINVISTINPGSAIPTYSASSTSLAYGIGVKYTIDRYLSVRAQYENLGKIGDDTTGTDTLSILTVGLTYNLGKPRPRTASTDAVFRGQQDAAQQTIALPPMRAIVFLDRAPAEDKQQLTAAIAQACQCQPTFVRMHTSTAVVYQVHLPPGQTFLTFKNALLPGEASLGLRGIMQSQ